MTELLQILSTLDPLYLAAAGLAVAAASAAGTIASIRARSRSKTTEPKPEATGEQKAVSSASQPATAAAGQQATQPILPTEESWLEWLSRGMQKTRSSLTTSLTQLLTGKKVLDADTLEQLHQVLYRADTGVKTSDRLVNDVRGKLQGEVTWPSLRLCLTESIAGILTEANKSPFQIAHKPTVILIVGVNGVGKTTTIGKLANYFVNQGKSVLLAAGDTYRAAAIEQLSTWGERLGVDVIRHQQGSDPAAVAFDAVKAAQARGSDVVIIDTAGRLHNRNDLMQELAKINRSINRQIPDAPHETWLVIDATTGQNAFMQVKAFSEVVKLSGLVVTKLDGTAKGGVVIGVTDQFHLPIRFLGLGEKATDLRPFVARDFAESLF
jgi:fused signal recognition particle receptor